MASTRSRLDEIVASFSTMEDPRSHINRRHPLPSVLVIAVLAVLAGAAGPTAIAQWAQCKADLLIGLLDLPHGIPGKDVFRRVLMMLKPEAFGDAFNAWIAHLRGEATAETGVERPIIAIDGKTARRSHDAKNGLGALHVVTAWAGELGLALGQQACAEKSNEITAIPELLKKIDVRGGIVTIDAMGTQKAIAEAIIGGGGRLRPGPEAEPGGAARGGHRAHRRAAGRGPGGCPGADDDRSRARPRGGADLPATAGPRGPAGRGRVGGAEVGRRGDVAARGEREGEHRGPLLPQQPAGGRGPVRPGGARPLVGGDPPARRPTKR